MDESFTLKARIASYWRYERQYPMVALEANTRLAGWNYGGQSDVLALSKKNILVETEIKISLQDLRHDREKEKHYHFYLDYFGNDSLVPDVKGWRRHREWLVKRTRWHHDEYTYPVSRFYFAVPRSLEKEAMLMRTELYPYAGLLIVGDTTDGEPWTHANNLIIIAKHSRHFIRTSLDDDQMIHMEREMSATICRLARKVDKLNNG